MAVKETWNKAPVQAPAATDDIQTEAYRLGGIEVAPGDVADGRISLGTDVNGQEAGFDVRVFHGRYQGPRVLIQAGVHGDEYDGQEAIRRLFPHLDPAELHGTVIAIPCLSETAFVVDQRVSGVDGCNFNRIFPGSANGTFSNRLADLYIREIIPAADAMVDIHTGGAYGQIAPLAVVQGGFEELAQPLGMAAGNEILWKGGAWGGTSRIAFLEAGKPAVTLEYGGGAYRDAVVEHHLGSLLNILRYMGVLAGEAKMLDRYRRVDATFAPASAGGFYVAYAEPGDEVKSGALLADIVDHLGEVRERVTAPNDGVVVWIRRRCAINIGEESIIFGTLVSEVGVA